jgi:dihydroflavonol-4-reductase
LKPSVFVTGGTGLLGTHLILALHRRGIGVRALYRSSIPEVVRHKAEWVQGDLLDVLTLEAAMHDIPEVYHAAGLVSFHPADKKALYQVNVEGTANLVNAALYAGVRKLVHVSSVAALGRIRQGETIHEGMATGIRAACKSLTAWRMAFPGTARAAQALWMPMT